MASLVVSPSMASVVVDTGSVEITATLTGSVAALSASLSGWGSLETLIPNSGVPFAYEAPWNGSGQATVTVTDATDGLSATCVITYGPLPNGQAATNAGPIMPALQYQLLQSGLFTGPSGIATQRVQIGVTEESFPYLGNFIILMPGSQIPDKQVIIGTGRHAQYYNGTFVARYIARNLRDMAGLDTYGLTNPWTGANPDVGMLPFAAQIANVLNSEFLLDSAGNFLSLEPVDPGTIGIPSYFGKDLAWEGVDISFSVAYLLAATVGPND